MRAALVLTEDSFLDISFIVGRGSPQAGPGQEPEGRKTLAHGAQPWVAGGPCLPAPERGVRGAAARVLPPRPGAQAEPSFSQRWRTVLTHWATVLRPSGLGEVDGQNYAPPGGPTV